jgi:uncharacterized protein YjiS (DUF1127 family)
MIQGIPDTGQRSFPLQRSRRDSGPQLMNLIKRAIVWLRARRQMRRAIDELMAFDDRTLADIGLSRGEIQHAVRNGRERDI